MSKDKVVLAYSGGLDTSIIIPWLREVRGLEVICVLGNVGQKVDDLDGKRQKALDLGALDCIVADLRDEYAAGCLVPAIAANAMYENKYPLLSALSRPVISAHLVEVAHRFGASAIAHGCTGKGNDQIRFETSVLMLDPTLDIIAPLREWDLHSRPEEVAYAREHGVDVSEGTGDNPYSIDDNLWGRAIECGALEDPWSEPPHDVWTMTADPQETPDDPAVCEIGFERGVPVSLDDVRMPLSELVVALNVLAGQYGFGRLDLMENRLVGLKSRECYEVPGALSIIIAHRALEDLTLERDVAHEKLDLERTWATCVYNGQWFSPLKRALDAFMAETQKGVTGVVRLRFLKGHCTVIGRKSARSLYDLGLATYDRDSTFDERAASGFLELQTLSLKTWAKVQGPDALACEPLACDLVANPALR